MPALATGVAAAFTAFQGSALGVFLTQNIFGRLLASVALSALASGLARSGGGGQGMQLTFTGTGGTLPCSFVLGRAPTGGDLVCPLMSQGKAGNTPLAWLTFVVSLGDVPGQTLSRLIVNGEEVEIGAAPLSDYGSPLQGKYLGYAWVKYYDGSQTAADPMLLARFGSYPERPWTASMIGRSLCYAVVTFLFNTSLFNGRPTVLFEMAGIPVYDPRKDSTVGGVGAHRWGTLASYEYSANLMVLAYNVMLGIDLPDIGVWGGGIAPEDLPTSSWFTAMNEADLAVPLEAGGSEPAFHGGLEVTVDKTPAQILTELLRGANAQLAEVGGIWKVRVGGPGLPVYFVTDEDFVVTRAQELDPAPGYDKRFNAITGRYYAPASNWQPTDAPMLTNSTWEAQDGDQRFIASVDYLAVSSGTQVQRLMTAAIAEERRFARHQGVLPPDAAILEPLDAIEWTSLRNGYSAKDFEVSQVADDAQRLLQAVSFRERDGADYVWTAAQESPVNTPSPVSIEPEPQSVAGWTVGAVTLSDGVTGRRPGLRLGWDASAFDQIDQLRYEIRLRDEGVAQDYATIEGSTATLILDTLAGLYAQDLSGWVGTPQGAAVPSLMLDTQYGRYGANETWADPQLSRIVLRGVVTDVLAGEHIVVDGILNATDYEGSAYPILPGPVVRSAWIGARTADALITNLDFEGGIQQLFALAGLVAPEIVTALPVTGNYPGRLVLLTSDFKLYRYTGTLWTSAVPISDVTGQALAADVLVANSVTAGLIAAGAISASAIDTASFGVSGLAVFGGQLKSSNYVTGSAGWMLNDAGTLEIQSLIERDALVAGAVTDLFSTLSAAEQSHPGATGGLFTYATLTIPAQDNLAMLKRGVSFEARLNNDSGTVDLALDFRIDTGGGYGAWDTVKAWSIPPSTTVWEWYRDSGNVTGPFQAAQYRLTGLRNISGGGGATSGIRNISLRANDQVK